MSDSRRPEDPPLPSLSNSLERAAQDLRAWADPRRASTLDISRLPWVGWGARRTAAKQAAESQLDFFRDRLEAIRQAQRALCRAAVLRAAEAAESALFEVRVQGENLRFSVLNRVQFEMTQQFLAQLERLEALRGSPGSSGDLIDALKQRALEEFTARMDRASRSDIEFGGKDAFLEISK